MRPPTAPKLDANTYVAKDAYFRFTIFDLMVNPIVFRYKTMSGSSQYRFGVLAKIVKFMRTRHQDGDDHPLTIEEILDETNQLDIGQSVKNVGLSKQSRLVLIIYFIHCSGFQGKR